MSRPTERTGAVKLPGKLDSSLGEFWVENPWEIVAAGHNLSSFERNRVYLNAGGGSFVEVSHLSGADSDGDGRGVVPADFRGNGQLDLLVRQAGGGALILYENRLPAKHYLHVSLNGRTGNKRGIGARLTAIVNGKPIVRELYPANTFASQAPSLVHFGLGDQTKVEKLTIRWPSGQEQVLTDVMADRHIEVTEGVDGPAAISTIVPGQQRMPK